MKKLIAAVTLSLAALAYGQDVSCPKAGCSSSGSGSVAVGDITGLGSGVAAWLATATSANLATAVSDETGTGALMFNINPVLENGTTAAGAIFFREDQDNGTNTVKLIGPASTADQILTLPSATDTLVGKATTDTLTNKTLTGPLFDNGATSAGYARYMEDSDNGTNYIQITGQDNLSANATLTLTGGTGALWSDNPGVRYFMEDDCDVERANAVLEPGCRWLDGTASGANSAITKFGSSTQTANHPGVVSCNAGDAITGLCYLHATGGTAGTSSLIPGSGYQMDWLVFYPASTSVASTDEYVLYMGVQNTAGGAAPASGIFLSYAVGTNSGNWVMNVCNNTSCTTGNSSTAVPFNAWRWYRWAIDSGGVHFYDCGATWPATGAAGCTEMANSPLVATNLPATTNHVSPSFAIVRAGASAATQFKFGLDYYRVYSSSLAR